MWVDKYVYDLNRNKTLISKKLFDNMHRKYMFRYYVNNLFSFQKKNISFKDLE